MTVLPIVKLCRHTNTMRLFTKVGKSRHSTVFKLNGRISNTKTTESVRIARDKYILDVALGRFMHQSTTPTCKIIGQEVVSVCDMQPGDQLTYKCKF